MVHRYSLLFLVGAYILRNWTLPSRSSINVRCYGWLAMCLTSSSPSMSPLVACQLRHRLNGLEREEPWTWVRRVVEGHQCRLDVGLPSGFETYTRPLRKARCGR